MHFLSWNLECLALPNAARSHKRHFFSPYCSNYVHSSVAVFLLCTSQTKLFTAYIMMCLSYHITIYIYIYIYSCSAHPVRVNPRCFPWKTSLYDKLCYFLFTHWHLRRNTKLFFHHTNPKIRSLGRVVRHTICSLLGQPQLQHRYR